MADERQEIEIKFNTNASSAAKDVNKLTDEIQEQKDLTIEFQKELAKLERQLKETPTNSLGAQKQLKGEISNLKDAIKDQGLAVKSLSNEKTKAVAVEKKMASAQSDTVSQVTKNGGAIATLDRLTGGYVSVLKDAYEGSNLFSGGMGKMLKSVKTFSTGAKAALISTGIGALVVLVGVLVSYWDDIVGLVSGVSGEMKNQNKLAEENAVAEEEKLATLNGQDNVLKLQGKTEKEILQLKTKQTDETIAALEAQLEQQVAVKTAQVEASQRNKDILSGILKFVSLPITLLLRGIDEIGKAFGKDFGLSKVFDNIANLVFDPDEVATEGDKTIAETKKKLDSLKNARAGYQLSIQSIDKEAAKKIKEDNDAALKAEKDRLKELLKERLDFENKLNDELEDLADKTDEEKLARQRTRAEEEIDALKQKGVDTLEIERLNAEKFDILEQELFDKRAEEKRLQEEKLAQEEADRNKKKADEELATAKALEEAKQAVREAGLSNVENIGKNLQVLAGKNKAVAKAGLIVEGAVGLANIVSSTMQANAKAVAAFPLTGGMPFTAINTVSGALSAAAQIKAVSTGLKALGGGSAGASPSFGGSGGAAGIPNQPPQVAFNNTAENQIGQSVARTQGSQNVIVSVLESDITTAQGNVNALISENTFGG